MGIKQVEFYHGAALTRLIRDSKQSFTIGMHESLRSAYILNESICLYFKYSSDRLSPWTFSFNHDHQNDILTLQAEYSAVFVVLICGQDGIACLDGREYRALLDDNIRGTEWIKASRSARQKYSLSGSDAQKELKLADNEFPSRVFLT